MTVLLNLSTPFTAGTTFLKLFLSALLYCKVRTNPVPFFSVLPWIYKFVLCVHVPVVRKCCLLFSGQCLFKMWMVAFLEVCRWLLGTLEVELCLQVRTAVLCPRRDLAHKPWVHRQHFVEARIVSCWKIGAVGNNLCAPSSPKLQGHSWNTVVAQIRSELAWCCTSCLSLQSQARNKSPFSNLFYWCHLNAFKGVSRSDVVCRDVIHATGVFSVKLAVNSSA